MTNKQVMIFQIAVRKYVDMNEKKYFFDFIYRLEKYSKKFWTKNAENFYNGLVFYEKVLRIQKLNLGLKSLLK